MSRSVLEQIRSDLFDMRDEEYHDFHAKLIPTVNPKLFIGVRTPNLRSYAKQLAKNNPTAVKEFLNALPHKYYDENNLHGFLIETIKDYNITIIELERFLPHIDNWATCDMCAPKIFKKHLSELLIKIQEWINSEHTYTKRFGVGMLMKFYLDTSFSTKYLELAASVQSEEYYVKMMVAWFFATALAKQYEVTLSYIENDKLDRWTHNKTIQKAIESYRISPEQKAYLRNLKIK